MGKKRKTDSEFYTRMLEAKKRKQEALEQHQLRAEFGEHPLPPTIVVKAANEVKLDQAFSLLQAKLRALNPTPADRLADAFNDLERKAQGL